MPDMQALESYVMREYNESEPDKIAGVAFTRIQTRSHPRHPFTRYERKPLVDYPDKERQVFYHTPNASSTSDARGKARDRGRRPNPLTLPQPIERLEFVRAFAPLAILAFLSSRLIRVQHWLPTSASSYRAPMGDYRQPSTFTLPVWLAVVVALARWRARCDVDRLPDPLVERPFLQRCSRTSRWPIGSRLFTVNKLGTVVAIALLRPVWRSLRRGRPRRRTRPPRVGAPDPRHWRQRALLSSAAPVSCTSVGHREAPRRLALGPQRHLGATCTTRIKRLFTYFLARSSPFAWTLFSTSRSPTKREPPLWYAMREPASLPLRGLGMHATIGLMFGR